MHYYVRGNGKALMLVHGFAEDGTIWDELASALSEDFMVIVPDLPGCGLSTWNLLGGMSPSLMDFADGLAGILDDLGCESCHMIGHSMGGYTALAFAEKYPQKLQSIGLFHSTAKADSEAKLQARERGIAFMHDHGVEAFLREAIPALYAERFRRESPTIPDMHIRQTLQWATVDACIGQYRAMMERPDRRWVLQEFKGPVLFLAGAQDRAVPLEESISQSNLSGRQMFILWDEVAHMGMKEAPDQCLEVLRAFLSQ